MSNQVSNSFWFVPHLLFQIKCNQWCHWFQEELQFVYPSTFPLHPRRATPRLFWGFSCSDGPKSLVIENYAILSKENVLKQQKTILETRQVLVFLGFFGVAMHPGTCRHCKSGCVNRTTQKTQLSLSIQHKLRNLLLQLTTITISID